MTAVLLFFLLGIILLAGEVFTPGGVLGVLGGSSMAAGVVIAFMRLGPGGGGLACFVALLALGATLYAELVWLPKSRIGKKLIVQSASDGLTQPPLADAAAIVGKSAEALTVLAPSGYVSVEGKRYEAFCQQGHVAKGATLRVVGLDNFRLIVSQS